MTIFSWASNINKTEMIGTSYNEQQIMMVTGPLSMNFYNWCVERTLRVHFVRFNIPNNQSNGFTYVIFHYKWPAIDEVRGINSAYMEIMLAWKERQGVHWLADNFVECVLGRR